MGRFHDQVLYLRWCTPFTYFLVDHLGEDLLMYRLDEKVICHSFRTCAMSLDDLRNQMKFSEHTMINVVNTALFSLCKHACRLLRLVLCTLCPAPCLPLPYHMLNRIQFPLSNALSCPTTPSDFKTRTPIT